MPERRVVREVVLPTLTALAHLHAAGIIHRCFVCGREGQRAAGAERGMRTRTQQRQLAPLAGRSCAPHSSDNRLHIVRLTHMRSRPPIIPALFLLPTRYATGTSSSRTFSSAARATCSWATLASPSLCWRSAPSHPWAPWSTWCVACCAVAGVCAGGCVCGRGGGGPQCTDAEEGCRVTPQGDGAGREDRVSMCKVAGAAAQTGDNHPVNRP